MFLSAGLLGRGRGRRARFLWLALGLVLATIHALAHGLLSSGPWRRWDLSDTGRCRRRTLRNAAARARATAAASAPHCHLVYTYV